MNTPASRPCFLSLHRLAKLTGRSRVTLLLRLKDGLLHCDAELDVGAGRRLPLFLPERAEGLKRGGPAAHGEHISKS